MRSVALAVLVLTSFLEGASGFLPLLQPRLSHLTQLNVKISSSDVDEGTGDDGNSKAWEDM